MPLCRCASVVASPRRRPATPPAPHESPIEDRRHAPVLRGTRWYCPVLTGWSCFDATWAHCDARLAAISDGLAGCAGVWCLWASAPGCSRCGRVVTPRSSVLVHWFRPGALGLADVSWGVFALSRTGALGRVPALGSCCRRHTPRHTRVDFFTLLALGLSVPKRGGKSESRRRENENRRRCHDWLNGHFGSLAYPVRTCA